MLQIYHVTTTRGMRVIWLCEELGLPIEITKIDFSQAYRATPEWRALSPVGKVPVMVDGDTVMFESCAMMQYVLDRYAGDSLRPDVSSPDYAQYLQWLWFGEATLSRPLGEIVNHGREFPDEARIPEVVAEMANRAADCLRAVGDHVATREYLVGDTFSAADISVGYGIHLAEMLTPDRIPDNLQDYWQRLKERPAFGVAKAA